MYKFYVCLKIIFTNYLTVLVQCTIILIKQDYFRLTKFYLILKQLKEYIKISSAKFKSLRVSTVKSILNS